MRAARSIRREIGQTRPFRSGGQAAVIGLLRTADRLRSHYARVVARDGLTLQQYNVLRILRGAGEEGLPTLAVAERMVEHEPGITRLLERLAAKRLVRRERGGDDRRQVWCRLEPAGRALVDRLDGPIDQADRAVARKLSPAQLRALLSTLDRIRENITPKTHERSLP